MTNTTIPFNDNWHFSKNNEPSAPVRIPHDWLIYNTNDLYENSVGTYRKIFSHTPDGMLKILRFDGVYMNSSVYINGQHAGDWKYGYTSFEFDITPYLREGENEITVKVVYESPNARWYTGAGIYRNVWLKSVNPTHIPSGGVYITPVKISDSEWKVDIDVEIAGDQSGVEITHEIFDPTGRSHRPVDPPKLWDIDSPNIYTVVTTLHKNGEIIHKESNTFGFRTIRFDTETGFYLNERCLKIYGVCQHHDLGALGAAMNPAALRRQLTILKEMGANGIRVSHNPSDPLLMQLADEMGFVVVTEILDMWERPKSKYDYSRFFGEWIEKDMASWVRRDRNHPSLIMWSVGNEIHDTHSDPVRSSEVLKMLMELVEKHDPRGHAPATFCTNQLPWENTQKVADLIKLVGYNYGEYLYNGHHKKYPDWVIYGSETGSVVQSRGIYHFPLSQSVLADDDEQCSSLGNSATSYGAKSAEANILADLRTPFSAGQFIWTGTDYIGEPTPYHTKNSYYGQIDTAGFPKDSFYIYKSAWTDYKTDPFIHIFPYWDFSPGQTIDVRVVSNAPKMELFFNGKSQGVFEKGERIVGDWQLSYEHGTLRAVAYGEDGSVVAECERKSFGDAAELVLKEEGEDLRFIEISAVDANGNPVENANNRIEIKLEGEGTLLGLDNGDSTDYDQYKGATSKRLFSGKLLAIVEGSAAVTASISKEEIPIRKIELTAEGDRITATIHPPNATYTDLEWRVTDAAGIDSNIATLTVDGNTATITKKGDGKAYVRCSTKNGREKTSLISYLDFEITGLGEAYLNPYGFIAGGLCNTSNVPMTNGNERGIATIRDGTSHAGFAGVDFGKVGADEITLPIFAMTNDAVPIEIWEGMPEEGGELITTVTYTSGSQWNTYIEETYKLPRRLRGITTICFVVHRKIHIKGFTFKQIPKAYEQLNAADCDRIYGDSFVVTEKAVEGIGNNVIIEFDDMEFANAPGKIQVYGRTSLDVNTIQLKFDDNDNVCKLDFKRSDGYEVQEFEVKGFGSGSGGKKVGFIFMPGCEFDFGWFRFVGE